MPIIVLLLTVDTSYVEVDESLFWHIDAVNRGIHRITHVKTNTNLLIYIKASYGYPA
ncbi:MAG: hypothetical protein JKX81_02115 [Arenicella sp.]|nr:hypothetical protein [Arenicella sp.]